jgi:hypothetical protein
MDPLTMGTIATVAPIAGGLIGNALSGGDRNAASDMLKQIYQKYADLNVPDTEKMRLALEDYKSAGNLNLQSEQAQQLGATDAYQNIQVDPRLRQAQMDQLQTLAKLGDTSFTPSEQAQLNKMQRSVESDNQARLKALLQGQDQRGVGSSDAALASRMISSQSAANRQASEADDQAAMAFNRALQAKQAAGTLGGQMEGAQYSQAANLANALNSREQQNMLQRAGVGQRNTANFNQAQMYNLQNQQGILNQNVGLHNQQQQYNKQLEQQNFNNQLAKLSGMQGTGVNVANDYMNKANATAGMWNNIGKGAGTMFGAQAMNKTQTNPVDYFKQFDQTPNDPVAQDNSSFIRGNQIIK